MAVRVCCWENRLRPSKKKVPEKNLPEKNLPEKNLDFLLYTVYNFTPFGCQYYLGRSF